MMLERRKGEFSEMGDQLYRKHHQVRPSEPPRLPHIW